VRGKVGFELPKEMPPLPTVLGRKDCFEHALEFVVVGFQRLQNSHDRFP
jgi:hypothetical protein